MAPRVEATLAAAKTGYPVFLVFQTAAGTTNQDAVVLHNLKICNAVAFMTGAGAAGDTVKLQKNTIADTGTFTDITDAVDCSAKVDKACFGFGTIDDAKVSVLAGETIRLVQASDCLARVTVEAIEEVAAA